VARIDLVAVRVVLIAVMGAGLTIVAGNVFDRYAPSLLLAVGVAVVAVLAVARLPRPVPLAARAIIVLVACGAAAVAVAVLAGGTFGDVVPRLVGGPRRLLTTEWPSPRDPTVLATLALFVGVVTAVATALARVRRLHLAPLAPLVVGLIALVALAAPQRPAWSTIAGLGAAAAAFALSRQGEPAVRRVAALRGEHGLAVALLVIAAVGTGVALLVGWTDRADPRRVNQPDSVAAILHPIEATVALRNAEPAFALFTITDESPLIGQQMPTRWRKSALDSYDGQRWVPRAAVRPIGSQLGTDSAADTGRAVTPVYFRIDVLAEGIDLVPVPGPPLELTSEPDLDVETDVDRVVVKLTHEAPVGTRMQLVAEPAPAIGEVTPAVVVTREIDGFARDLTDTAAELAGDGDPFERLARLEQALRSWQLDRNAPGAGQQQRLIEDFVVRTHRGTDEQFTTGFVLLARSLGFDARVATGFAISPDRATSPLTVSSSDAAAWPEVHVADVGWVAYDPVPDHAVDSTEPEPPPAEAQSPAAAQPPIDPPSEADSTDADDDAEAGSGSSGWGALATWFTRITTAIALVGVPLALAIGALLAVKSLRRRRRLRSTDPAQAVRGAWANVTDALVDAGLEIDEAWTDDRIAAMGAPLVGTAPPALARLAAMSTAATFGPPPTAATVHDAAAVEHDVTNAIADGFTPVARLRWRLSVRSLRKATRSPVTA